MLRQVFLKLPRYLQFKWGEYSVVIRKYEEPSLLYFEEWLNVRVLARREAGFADKSERREKDKFSGNVTQFHEEKSEDDAGKEESSEEDSGGELFNGAVTESPKCSFMSGCP